MSYLQVPVKIASDATMEYRIIGPSDTQPTPATGYTIYPESMENPNFEGKFWVEYRVISA